MNNKENNPIISSADDTSPLVNDAEEKSSEYAPVFTASAEQRLHTSSLHESLSQPHLPGQSDLKTNWQAAAPQSEQQPSKDEDDYTDFWEQWLPRITLPDPPSDDFNPFAADLVEYTENAQSDLISSAGEHCDAFTDHVVSSPTAAIADNVHSDMVTTSPAPPNSKLTNRQSIKTSNPRESPLNSHSDNHPPEAPMDDGMPPSDLPPASRHHNSNTGELTSMLSDGNAADNHSDMLTPGRAEIYAESVKNAPTAQHYGLRHAGYRIVQQGTPQPETFSDRAGNIGARAVMTGTGMAYSVTKDVSKSIYRAGKHAVLLRKDLKDGLVSGKKDAALKEVKFLGHEGKRLVSDAGSRLLQEGILIVEDFEGSDDLGIQAMVGVKNVVRDMKYRSSVTRRLLGKRPGESKSIWNTVRRIPSAISKVGNFASRIFTSVTSSAQSFGLIAGIAFVLALVLMMMPAAFALTGAMSLAADDKTLTEVYTYITELDANLSKQINEYRDDADVVNFYVNGSQTVDDIEIITAPDPILNYLDCKYGEYKFSDVKAEIDGIYSAIYHLDTTSYTQDVSGTPESGTVVDPDTEPDTDDNTEDSPGLSDIVSTYTPTYGGTVSKKAGSTLTTAILANSKCAGTFKLTFYCGCAICSEQWGNQTATGVTAQEGRTIAVDPKVIPYGTKVHIDGFGDFIAEDCGGAIKGNHIDVFVENHQRANTLGVQYAAVYVMNSSIVGGIYLPGIGTGSVSHMDVNVTSESLMTYLQGLLDENQQEKSKLMNQLGQYTTHMNFGSPLENDSWYVSRRYGYRYDGNIKEHFGIDISTTNGQTVLSVSSGTVSDVGSDNAHNSYVIITSGKNQFLYSNLGSISVSEGTSVKKGDTIAKTGSTASGCESSTLHMEYTKDGTSLNPAFYLYNASAGGATSVGSSDIVEVARSQLGQVGGQPYWSYMGFSSRVAWCASFVSWCANQCGYIDAGIIPKHAACADGVAWFKQRGQWQDRNYTPAPGDIIYFDFNHVGVSHHVGIVARVEGNTVYTIEGNSSNAVNERHYTIGQSTIMGYGIPQYSN